MKNAHSYNVDLWCETVSDNPEGQYCGFCGLENFYFDDVGWFYVTNPKDGVYKATCCREGCPPALTAER